MLLNELTDEFILYLSAVRGLSDNTCAGYKNDLAKLMDFLTPQMDVCDITKENLLLCIGQLSKQKMSSATVNRFIAAVRTMFAYARKFNYIQKNPALELKTVKLPKKMPRFMTQGEVNELCSEPVTKELLWGNRDLALFKMLYSSGCRVSEITNLALGDFRGNYSSAVVTGKGNKQRIVYFDEASVSALRLYLADRTKVIAQNGIKEPTEKLFINQKGELLF